MITLENAIAIAQIALACGIAIYALRVDIRTTAFKPDWLEDVSRLSQAQSRVLKVLQDLAQNLQQHPDAAAPILEASLKAVQVPPVDYLRSDHADRTARTRLAMICICLASLAIVVLEIIKAIYGK